MADLVALRQRFELHVEVVERGGGEAGFEEALFHAFLELRKAARLRRIYADLRVNEAAHVFSALLGLFVHEAFDRLSGYEFGDYRPFALGLGHFEYFRNVEPRLLDFRVRRGFREDSAFRVVVPEYLDAELSVAVDGL